MSNEQINCAVDANVAEEFYNKYDFTYSLDQEPDLVIMELSAASVNEWIWLAEGDLAPSFRNRHFVALITNEVFQADYLPHAIDLPFLRQQNMIYYRETAVSRLHLESWQNPRLN